MATLCERVEDDGFDRRDYSLQAWDAQARPEGLFSYWKAAVPHPDDGRRVFVDDDVLWDLFEQLADDPRRRRMAYRFIIALILMRKRRLRYIGRTGQGENERWLMLPKGAEMNQQPIEVVNPRLGDEDVRELSEQLREVLRGEL